MALVPAAPLPAVPTPLDSHRRRPDHGLTAEPLATDVRLFVCHPAPLAGQAISASLRSQPGIAEVEVVTSSTDLLRACAARCDVALISEALAPELPDIVQAMAFRGLAFPVLMATTDADPDVAAQYLEWGAAGAVDVRRAVAVVVAAVRIAASGSPVLDDRSAPDIVTSLERRAAHRESARALLHALSPRERLVIESLAGGTGVAEIARTQHLSPHTIRACIRTLGPKLGVTGQLQIAAVARQLMADSHPPAPSRYLRRIRASGGPTWRLSG